MMIQQKSLQLRLHSPAFLGDAHQSGVWRTPPIKALLREWWRVAAAPESGYDHRSLRETEGLLFGNAWLEPDADKNSRFCKSKVRMALGHWDEGKMRQHEPQGKIDHPNTTFKVEPLNYLGYGPIDKGQFKNGAALQANETNTLDLAWPVEDADAIAHTLQLINWFGTLGGRSRNGWGSLSLGLEPLSADHAHLAAVLRDLKECLKLDWPHAIGSDNKGALIWESAATFDNWPTAMKFLASTKIGFRTSLKFEGGEPHRQPQERHVLAYPVTHHKVSGWGNETRLANQIRFKLFSAEDNKLKARIYHTPHKSPLAIGNIDELAVWQRIHRWLDDPQNKLTRLGAKP
ncbi:MAG: hypothetical protein CO125_07315 [Hydrogenophilales bacterium CG_4_9_14_3_um_filter_59_35]|nr:MAG: hypothetical protein COZ23_05485 [Hydrogenophilales bacterium CG_4_10_14_3_um_filter_58_23]PJB06311.1 MAG: hypothetical protein CO125_07315 [Hydrogenophilales bacterium CG_4_9_14_3_um_filter_59_35]